MQRISHPTANAGRFTEGDAQTGIPATVLTADWANAVQEELCGLLEGSGISLNPDDNAQLLSLFRRLNRPSLAFGDFFPVDGSAITGQVAATLESDEGTLVLAHSGELLRFVGRHCETLHNFETTFGDQTWLLNAGDQLVVISVDSTNIVTRQVGAADPVIQPLAELSSVYTFSSSVFDAVVDPVTHQLILALPCSISTTAVGLVAVHADGHCDFLGRVGSAGPGASSLALSPNADHLVVATQTSAAGLVVTVAERTEDGWGNAAWKECMFAGMRSPDSLEDYLVPCGLIRVTWAPELDAIAVAYFAANKDTPDIVTQRFALVDRAAQKLADNDNSTGFWLQSAFRWRGATYWLGFAHDFTRLALFTLTQTGWLQRVREWTVDEDRLQGALSAIQYSGNFPKTLALAADNLVLIAIQGEAYAMTDPVFAPLTRSLCGDHIIPVALCSDGRRLAWDHRTYTFWVTTKLF